jgi:hypothetical protein
LANAACVYLEYIGQSIWPANLAILYPVRRTMGEAVPAGIILLAITAAAIHFAKQRPYLLTGWDRGGLFFVVMVEKHAKSPTPTVRTD